MARAGSTKGPTRLHFALAALVVVAVVLLLSGRDSSKSSPEDAKAVAEQRTQLESEQRARGLVEVQPSR